MEIIDRILDKKYARIALAALFASFLWLYVALGVANEHTKVIKNVPVNFQYRQSAYTVLGLDIIETDIETVDVTVTGPRSVTGDLTAEDIIVYPNITGINGAGKYTFTLTAERTSSVKNFTIDSLGTDSVTMRLDTIVTKEFPVEVDISTIIVAPDCMAEMPTTNPSTVTITGPEYKINTVSRVVAATVGNETISTTSVLQSEIRLYDENDALMDAKYLTVNRDSVDITIPVVKEVIVPVKIRFTNKPSGFNTDNLHISLSVSNIRLAVPAANRQNITEYIAGYIDLNALEPDKDYVFDLSLPNGCRSMDAVTQITASVSGVNLAQKTIDVTEISVINDRDGNVDVVTDTIKGVTVIGDKGAVEKLQSGDVIAQIDMSKLSAAVGQQTVEVSFVIPSTDRVYVMGKYTVNIRI